MLAEHQDATFQTFGALVGALADHSSAKTAFDKLLLSLQQLVQGHVSITHVRVELEQLLRLLTSNNSSNGVKSNGRPTATSPPCNTSSSAYSSDCSPLSSLLECASLCPLSGSLSSSSLPVDSKTSSLNVNGNKDTANNIATTTTASNSSSSVPPPPPPPPLCNGLLIAASKFERSNWFVSGCETSADRGLINVAHLVPNTPRPRTRMKTLNWSKIPAQKVLRNSNNIWSQLLNKSSVDLCLTERDSSTATTSEHLAKRESEKKRSDSSLMPLDFETLERLFSQHTGVNTTLSGSAPNSCPNSPRTSRRLTGNPNLVNAIGHAFKGGGNVGTGIHNTCTSNWNGSNGSHSLANSTSSPSIGTSSVSSGNWASHHSTANYPMQGNFAASHMANGCNGNACSATGNASGLYGVESNDANGFTASYASLERRLRSSDRDVGTNEPQMLAQMLDTQKSLNVSIFLKQFRNEQQVLDAIRLGAADQLGAERLLHLLRLFPDQAEVQMLCSIDELRRLPPAERFLVKLLSIPR